MLHRYWPLVICLVVASCGRERLTFRSEPSAQRQLPDDAGSGRRGVTEFPFDNPRTGDAVPQAPDMPPEESNANCDAGSCTCDSDFECPEGSDCVQGRCLQECDDDRDCGSGWFCEDGECISAELISP